MTGEEHRGADARAAELMALLDDSFTAHRAAALALARRILGDAELAEDAVQLAFVQILARLRAGDARLLAANPRAVVLRGTRWAALKLAERDRDRHAGASLDDHPCASADPWERADARLLSQEIVAALPPHYRDALVLRYVEDQSDDSAAARLALTVKAYRRRLDRALLAARSNAARLGTGAAGAVLPLVWPRGRRWVRARWLRLDARVHQARARLGPSSAGPGFSHLAAVVALAGISVAVVAPQGAATAPVVTAPPQARVADALGAAPGVTPPPAPTGSHAGGAAAVGAAPPSRPWPQPTPTSSQLSVLPSSPPTQASIQQVLPADRYESNHVIVLNANDPVCQCTTLYRSDDGGATWQGFRKPQWAAGYFLLTPHYPQDPRILFSGNLPWTSDGGQTTECLLPDITATSCTVLPLTGSVAFDADFDSGNPVIYGAAGAPGPGSLVAYNVVTGTTQPMALPGGFAPTEVFAPRADSVSGTYVRGGPLAPSADGSNPPQLYWCDAQLRCHPRSDRWNGDYLFQLDRMDGTGLVVGSQVIATPTVQFALSVDGGTTQPYTWPDGGESTFYHYALTGPPSDLSVLVTVPPSGGNGALVWRWRPNGSIEQLASLPAAPGGQQDGIVAVTPSRLIAFPRSNTVVVTGLWCSVDGGRSWQAGCPPDR